jgi:hypothetical protein
MTRRVAAILLAAISAAAQNHLQYVPVTGQSLSVGTAGAPALTLTQPYGNLKTNSIYTALYSLTEDSGNETGWAMMCNSWTKLAGARCGTRAYGVSGTAYSGLKKGTAPYANSLNGLTGSRTYWLNQNGANTFGAAGVVVVHGEADWTNNVDAVTYSGYLREWQQDYTLDINAITGQSGQRPLFTTQNHSWTHMTTGRLTPVTSGGANGTPIGHWEATKSYWPDIILCGPKYQLAYTYDGIHLSNYGYRRMGAMYGRCVERTLAGRPWKPLSPMAIRRQGSRVEVKFHVPAPPIVLDTTSVAEAANSGFEFAQEGGNSVVIASVAITRPDTIVLELSAEPTGTNQRVRYAYTGQSSPALIHLNTGRAALLTADIDATATAMTVTANPGFSSPAVVRIGSELIRCSASGTDLTGCVRGQFGTVATAHSAGETVTHQATMVTPRGNVRDSEAATGEEGEPLHAWLITFDEPVGFCWLCSGETHRPQTAGRIITTGRTRIGAGGS